MVNPNFMCIFQKFQEIFKDISIFFVQDYSKPGNLSFIFQVFKVFQGTWEPCYTNYQ